MYKSMGLRYLYDIMNIIMVIVSKVLFPYGLSSSYIMIHSVIFRNGPTNVSNLGKRVLVLCRVPPLPPKQGLGHDTGGVGETNAGVTSSR